MDSDYSWRNVRRGSSYRPAKREGAGVWIAVALALALLIHIIFLLIADKITFSIGLYEDDEIETDWLNLQRVEVEAEPTYEELIPESETPALPDPPDSTEALLKELALLEDIPDDFELDIRPDISEANFKIALEDPALKGDEFSDTLEPTKGPDIDVEIPELGNLETELQESQNGRIIVDPGKAIADEFDPDEATKEMAKKGLAALSEEGIPDGFTSLDKLLRLDGNTLGDEKGMIGSDLLFEFNQFTLRESARISLMKVAMLIDKNPQMYCWLEGHTDTIGSDISNTALSQQRAQAVKDWLVTALSLPSEQIIIIGKGESNPIILEGDQDAQALNRRVEIKMRKEPPPVQPVLETPEVSVSEQSADPFENAPTTETPLNGDATPEPVAVVVEEEIPVAVPVEEDDIPIAVPVEEPEPIPAEPVIIQAEPVGT